MQTPVRARRVRRSLALVTLVTIAALATTAAASARTKEPQGFKTSQPPMLVGVAPGVTVEPLINVGEKVGGYTFESIPDGIVPIYKGGKTVDVYVNHETSTVPFPLAAPPTRPVAINDFTNAMLSKLTLAKRDAGILAGEYVVPSTANYHRFCSNFLVGRAHGFSREIIFLNEEATDWIWRTGESFRGFGVTGAPGAEQLGVVAAYDVASAQYRTIYGMGRHNHENSVGLEGYGRPVILSGDDTFTAPSSQVYLYTAPTGDAVWNDQGTLYAFKSDNAAINDYGDLSGPMSVSGAFIEVPRAIATGKRADGSDVLAADFGYPAPPSGVLDGPQWVLEHWSNVNNVFQFIRIEDIAYDRKQKNVVYMADTGEPRALPDPTTTRLRRGPSGTIGPYPNGRIFKFVFDKKNPLKVLSLSIQLDGDALGPAGSGNTAFIHQPDNVETTTGGLLIQEDPGGHNQYAPDNPAGTTARIWHQNLQTGVATVVARVNQAPYDATQPQGAWESSGIVHAKGWGWGKDAFLVDVQAPTLVVDRAPGPPNANPQFEYQREGGQLLLVHIPQAAGDS
jgi:hypothetical protein